MKKFIQFNIFLFLISIGKISAQQDNSKFTKDIIPASPEVNDNNKLIRNTNVSTIVVNGVTIDKRAAKYYAEGSFNSMPVDKLQQINNIYIGSFEIVKSKNELDNICKEKIKNNFDLGSYNHLRKPNARVEVPVSFEGCEFTISLFSWQEVNSIK